MKIGIAGYGRMGRLIHRMALSAGHEVPLIVDPASKAPEVIAAEFSAKLKPVDVIIDFTLPGTVLSNVKRYGELKTAAVIGTTGWYTAMDKVAEVAKENGIGIIWSGNFSLGVNLFFHLAKAAGKIMNRFNDYDVAIHEMHHRFKADSPSGTAEMLGHIMLNSIDRKKRLLEGDLNRPPTEDELHISSTRCGAIPGTHRVIFDSENDSIAIEHLARNREGFAEGAVKAAEWIYGRSGLYNIDDMMENIIGGEAK